MLKLVLGRAGSGKSTYCIEEMTRLAREGRRSALIVPEQSSVSFERALTLRLPGELRGLCEIKSFRKLCDDVFAECGGGALPRAATADKCALMRRAMRAVEGELRFYKKHRRDGAFFALAVSVADELRNAGVDGGSLREIAQRAQTELSRDKLSELALLCEAYEALLSRSFLDEADALTHAASLVPHAARLDGVTVFLDGYSGFTEPEHRMIEALLQKADDVICTLGCEDIFSDAEDSLSTVRLEGRRLRALADRANVRTAIPLRLEGFPRFQNSGLSFAERYFGSGEKADPSASGVYVFSGADPYDEAGQAAVEILFLVREHNFAFADIAVIARDTERYKNAVERTFARCDIPLFADRSRNMLRTAPVELLLSALALTDGLSTDAIFRFLKTGLTSLPYGTVCELENYCFVWNIDHGGWFAPFVNNPDGFGELAGEESVARLTRVESARKTAVGWFADFAKETADADGAQIIEAAWRLWERCGAVKALENADEAERREAALGVGILEKLHRLLGNEHYTVAELGDMAAMLAANTPVGEIPQGLEQVTFGAADRARTANPRAVFLLGVNEGIFPRNSFDSPLLTMAERELLSDNGAALSRTFAHSAAMEELYFYRAATCARERLYFSWSRAGLDGAGLQPSARLESFLNLAHPGTPESASLPCPGAVNARTAAALYAEALETDDAPTAALLASAVSEACARVDAAALDTDFSAADPSLPKALLGENCALSATRIDQFSECRFAYFLKYVLRVRPLQKAELSPLEAGSFVHGILENTLKAFGGDLTTPDEPALRAQADACADEYVASRLGESAKAPRVRYLVERLKAQAGRLLMQLRREQEQSEFRPADYELKIGPGAEIEPTVLETPDGEKVYVVGSVDRVDVLRRDGQSYIRVVDYKTGDKKFSLSDVYYGLNIQMLLYLFTVCDNGGARYGDPVPAAVMYMPSDPSAPNAESGDERAARLAYRMDGLVLDDPEVVHAMEKEVGGLYIPIYQNRDGSFKKSDKLASAAKLGLIHRHIEKTVLEMAEALYAGEWDVCPATRANGHTPCDWCDYFAVCRHDRSEKARELTKPDPAVLFNPEAEGGEQP